MTFRILTGDCREVLATPPEASVHCCVTSPPYFGLRDYGTATWDGGDATCQHRGREKPRQDTTGSGPDNGCFAATRGSQWLGAHEARLIGLGLPWVPVVASDRPFELDTILAMAEGPSLIAGADHVREGVVVKPMTERTDPTVGRVNLKVVGNGYFERKG